MIHSELELAPLPVHLAVNDQAAFTVTQRLNVFPLKLRQLDPFSGLPASLEQFQTLSMDGQPNIALRLLLPTFPALPSMITVIVHIVIDVIIVARVDAILGLVVDVVRGGALGQPARLPLVTRQFRNILAGPQSRYLDPASKTLTLLRPGRVVDILTGIDQSLAIGRLSPLLLRHHLLQLLRVHCRYVIMRPVIRKRLRVSYEHLLGFVRIQTAPVAMGLMEAGTKCFRPFVVHMRLMLIYAQDQRFRDVVL